MAICEVHQWSLIVCYTFPHKKKSLYFLSKLEHQVYPFREEHAERISIAVISMLYEAKYSDLGPQMYKGKFKHIDMLDELCKEMRGRIDMRNKLAGEFA